MEKTTAVVLLGTLAITSAILVGPQFAPTDPKPKPSPALSTECKTALKSYADVLVDPAAASKAPDPTLRVKQLLVCSLDDGEVQKYVTRVFGGRLVEGTPTGKEG